MPAWLTEEYCAKEVQPRLKDMKVREIANAIKVSHGYAALVRAGKRRPHPRHWSTLVNICKPWLNPITS